MTVAFARWARQRCSTVHEAGSSGTGWGRLPSRTVWAGPRQLGQDLHRPPRLCAAIVRLTFNGANVETGTESYRLAQTMVSAKKDRPD